MFVALDLPEAAREELAGWRDGLLRARTDLRAVPADHLHVTLAFLGWQDEAAATAIAAAAAAATGGLARPRLTAGEVRAVPPRGTRLFALDLLDEDRRATALQAAVSGALEGAGVYRPERRPWWPHITIARVKRGVSRVEPLGAGPPALAAIEPPELTLYRSTLRLQGALYEALARTTLPG